MASYVDNTYNWLKRKGYAEKYECAGIYCIKVDDLIVYVGKSQNMLRRISEHYVGIQKGTMKKYRILEEVKRKGHNINFDVLYYAISRRRDDIEKEIGEKEGEYIRKYQPVLNTQIPKTENWHKWDIQEVDAARILKMLI